MLIEIQCQNFSQYSPELGRYVECGKKMIVSDDQVGLLVKCDQCGQDIEVTPSRKPTSTAGAAARPNAPATTARKRAAAKAASTTGAASQRTKKTTAARKRTPAVAASGSGDVMAMEFGRSEIESTLVSDRRERCKKCGNIRKLGRCTVCRHVDPLYKKIHQPLDEFKVELAGAQLWFTKTISQGISVRILGIVLHVLFGILMVLLALVGLSSLTGTLLGPVLGLGLVFVVCVTSLIYIGFAYQGYRLANNPRARLAWFQKPIWNFVLVLSRAMNWQAYDGSLKGRKIVTIRDPGFGDKQISGVEDIEKCQVFDAQGTSISDRGLLELYHLKHLHCVVLIGTNVTADGVFRLQQSFPKLWIWY